jgi:hypothetical protein
MIGAATLLALTTLSGRPAPVQSEFSDCGVTLTSAKGHLRLTSGARRVAFTLATTKQATFYNIDNGILFVHGEQVPGNAVEITTNVSVLQAGPPDNACSLSVKLNQDGVPTVSSSKFFYDHLHDSVTTEESVTLHDQAATQ